MDIRLVGESRAWSNVLDQVSKVAPLNRPVLVIGERGTGKELVAARIHYLSARWDAPFLQLNCATVSESLLQSELFGHESGAFTGANRRHVGRFERANEGSLFLDELATMSSQVQEQLLRVVEYGQYERVGGTQPIDVDVRLIAATNEDLPSLVERGEFRADLLDRLAFDVITLPPLRVRDEDIMLLAHHFATQMCVELELDQFNGFSASVEEQLRMHAWPGNVRELRNVVERSIYQCDDLSQPIASIVLDPFNSPYRPNSIPVASEGVQPCSVNDVNAHEAVALNLDIPLKKQMASLEQRLLDYALNSTGGHQRRAAERLGVTYHQLRALLRKYPESRSGASV